MRGDAAYARIADPDALDVRNREARYRLAHQVWYAYPWKFGTWLSLDGTLYEGNGGNEREQAHWEARGPWMLLGAEAVQRVRERAVEDAAFWKAKYEALRGALDKVVDDDDDR